MYENGLCEASQIGATQVAINNSKVKNKFTVSIDPIALAAPIGSAMENRGTSIVLDIPVIIPLGLHPSGGQTGSFEATLVSGSTVRSAGRSIGSYLPVLQVIGLGLTVAPAQIENAQNGAPAAEYIADFGIDFSGFAITETINQLTVLLGGLNPGSLFAGAGAELLTGIAWENSWGSQASRDQLQATLKALGSVEPIPYPGAEPLPVPVPEPPPLPYGTPQPQ